MTPLVLALLLAATGGPLHRYALVVGENTGDPDDVVLRYAEGDAERIARILREVGGVRPEDLTVLTDVDAADLRRVLISLNARLRGEAEPTLLFVFYSGHGDAEALHLHHSRLDVAELRGLVAGSPATARVLVVDSCRSGALTQVKGGHRAPSFAVNVDAALAAQGTAILTSSAANEDSQESDRLGASFFTHFLASGLLGAADANGDGKVSLAEAFAYAAARTLEATERTLAGPQHPTYRFDLGGRGDLVLTDPGAALGKLGALAFPPGACVVHRGGFAGAAVAEVASDGARRLALLPGDYAVSCREPSDLRQGAFTVRAGETTDVVPADMERIEYAQVVRKGGSARRAAWSAFLLGGARGELFSLGTAAGGAGGVRLDLSQLSLELRLGYGSSQTDSSPLDKRSVEYDAGLAALRSFDLGPLTLGIGLWVSGLLWAQDFHDPQTPNRVSEGLLLGPLGSVQLPLYRRLYLRLDAAALTYLVPQGDDPTAARLATPFTWTADLGVGVFF
ncbi:MAG: caspase family protein [Myxococcales bacterium]